ncbi:MAG TPA: hypothetical protein VHO50_03895, partial [Bacteroidales bacterium]|nr:hypothetical protein [Bacteroidales bacterium]
MRIQASTGDLIFGGASVGTVKAEDELNMRMDGDVYGSSILQLRNRTGENGAIFQTIPNAANIGTDLVDFIFRAPDGAGTIQRNIRFEARATYARAGDPSFHLGGSVPDVPTLALGDGYAHFNTGVRIGVYDATIHPVPAPTALLHLDAGTTAAGTAPLKFSSGSLLTTTEAGAIEFNNNSYYATITTGAGSPAARGIIGVFLPTINLNNATQTITPLGSQIYTMSPTANRTITFDGASASVGSTIIIMITQTTNVSRTITFSGDCLKQGTLSTGNTINRSFVVTFVFDGTNFIELSRTGALN